MRACAQWSWNMRAMSEKWLGVDLPDAQEELTGPSQGVLDQDSI